MKRLMPLLLAVLMLGAWLPAHAIDPLPFKSHAEELRFQKLTRQLRCLVCQNESLADSNAKLAKDLRHQVFKLMQEGKSDAEIKQYLVDRYSDYVLYDPPIQPSTWLLWFGPGIILLFGAMGLILYVRRRNQAAPAAPPPVVDPDEDW